MLEYTHDVFYSDQLDYEDKRDLIIKALERSYEWWADEIKNGGQRQKIDVTFEEQLNKMDENSLFRFIHRKGFPDDKRYLSVVFNELASFLWVNMEEEHLQYFIDNYNLKAIG